VATEAASGAIEQPRVTGRDARAAAFRRLIDAELDRSYRLAAVMLNDASEAEDAVHDAAVSAWQRFGDLREADRFEAWFGRILVNRCRDRLRARRRRRIVDLTPVLADPGRAGQVTPDHADLVLAREAIERALPSLSADHLAVVVLRYDADLTVPAIAERLGVAEGTVKSRLHHALRQLRAAIEPEEGAR
jgi:RNA polymerase sigma-70 factor (ECF subfamily)